MVGVSTWRKVTRQELHQMHTEKFVNFLTRDKDWNFKVSEIKRVTYMDVYSTCKLNGYFKVISVLHVYSSDNQTILYGI